MSGLRTLVIALLGLAAFTASATASTIRSNATSFTGVASRTLTLDPGGLSIRCDLTFVLSVSSTSVTASGLPATLRNYGFVAGRPGTCDGGFITMFNGQPWDYDAIVSGGAGSVNGTTTFLFKRVGFAIGDDIVPVPWCDYEGNVQATLNSAGTTLTVNTTVPFSGGTWGCPQPGRLQGTVAVSPAVRLTLS